MIHIILLLFGALAMTSLAADTRAQMPGTVKNNTVDANNNPCDTTTVGVVGGGQIVAADCFDIMDSLSTANFSVEMSNWRDSTDLPDEYYKLFTVGTCELAVKRIDGGNGTAW